jgi:hypothetical protein
VGERRELKKVCSRIQTRPGHGWKDNIKMYLRKVGCGGKDWIEVAQDRD